MVNGSSRHVNRRMASGSIRKKQLKEAEQPIDDAHENGIGHIRVDSLNDSVSPPQYGHKMSRLKFLKTNQREEKPGFFG